MHTTLALEADRLSRLLRLVGHREWRIYALVMHDEHVRKQLRVVLVVS